MKIRKSLTLALAAAALAGTTLAGQTELAATDDLYTLPVAAEIQLEGGSVIFVDETIEGVFGLGVLEVGRVNLAPLYELGASPLEIFMALSPEGAQAPPILFEAHERARAKTPSIPAEPRDFARMSPAAAAKAINIPYHTFANDTDNCWGWGNVNDYHDVIGNEPGTWNGHESNNAYSEFINWSMVPGGTMMTSSSAYFDENAELGDRDYATPFGHERGVAMCVTHAIWDSSEGYFACSTRDSSFQNTVNYRVRLLGTNGTSTWGSDNIYVNSYGEGVRYRSSSSQARKYTLQVVDVSKKSILCKERYDVYTRSRFAPPIGL